MNLTLTFVSYIIVPIFKYLTLENDLFAFELWSHYLILYSNFCLFQLMFCHVATLKKEPLFYSIGLCVLYAAMDQSTLLLQLLQSPLPRPSPVFTSSCPSFSSHSCCCCRLFLCREDLLI